MCDVLVSDFIITTNGRHNLKMWFLTICLIHYILYNLFPIAMSAINLLVLNSYIQGGYMLFNSYVHFQNVSVIHGIGYNYLYIHVHFSSHSSHDSMPLPPSLVSHSHTHKDICPFTIEPMLQKKSNEPNIASWTFVISIKKTNSNLHKCIL